MDPLWVLLAEGWWAVPAAVTAATAGTLGWLGVRARRAGRVRRLEIDAARHDVQSARASLTRSRAAVQTARAGIARAEADRMAGRASIAEAAAARRDLRQAQREVAAANADLTARRADVRAARAARPSRTDGPDALPLARLKATHDAINAEWIAYETDPAKAVAYPSMTDVREPLTIAFLEEQRSAQWLRPGASRVRVSPADYAAYRDAVRRMSRAFSVAEREARRRAGEPQDDDARTPWWSGFASDFADEATRRIVSSAEAIARAAASSAWPKRRGERPPDT